ncbi:MAG: hypothetical protein IJO47_02310 [Clostridia bacterium]|nr:hypothetical protein [Clostridia bacterium]
MLSDMKFGLKQRFNIKCSVDLTVFVLIVILFVSYAMRHDTTPYESLGYFAAILGLFIPTHIITKQWISKAIRKSLTSQSETLSETTSEVIDTLNSQKKIVESLNILPILLLIFLQRWHRDIRISTHGAKILS